jgi:hypothetical protein
MFWLDDEIRAAQWQKDQSEQQPLRQGHGLHAFVFLSFILAEALNRIIETWTDFRGLSTPEVIFLSAITLLVAQYWWVIYEAAFFYGRNVFNFASGALEVALLYAIAYRLRTSHDLRWPLYLFGTMIILFILVDLIKYLDFVGTHWHFAHIAPRQLLRLIATVVAFRGGSEQISASTAASILLVLVFVYMGLTGYARWKTT